MNPKLEQYIQNLMYEIGQLQKTEIPEEHISEIQNELEKSASAINDFLFSLEP